MDLHIGILNSQLYDIEFTALQYTQDIIISSEHFSEEGLWSVEVDNRQLLMN